MSAWSHLPNAHHIDWVLESVTENPELWDAAWLATRSAVGLAAWLATRDAALYAARCEASDAIAALVAYDDCDQFLSMSYEKLRVWSILSKDPRAVLLLPMVYVKERLNEHRLVTSA